MPIVQKSLAVQQLARGQATRRIPLRLPDEQAKALDRAAAVLGCSRNLLVVQAVDGYLDQLANREVPAAS